jgi:hypothetical protein
MSISERNIRMNCRGFLKLNDQGKVKKLEKLWNIAWMAPESEARSISKVDNQIGFTILDCTWSCGMQIRAFGSIINGQYRIDEMNREHSLESPDNSRDPFPFKKRHHLHGYHVMAQVSDAESSSRCQNNGYIVSSLSACHISG